MLKTAKAKALVVATMAVSLVVLGAAAAFAVPPDPASVVASAAQGLQDSLLTTLGDVLPIAMVIIAALFAVGLLFVLARLSAELTRMAASLMLVLNLVGAFQAVEWWQAKQGHVKWCRLVAEGAEVAPRAVWDYAVTNQIGASQQSTAETKHYLQVLSQHGMAIQIKHP